MQQVSDKETEIILELAGSAPSDGDFVEMGCYRGDTSLLLARLGRPLWLYDSFEGLPEKTLEDTSVAGDNFKAGELLVSKAEVVLRFKKAGLKVPRIKKAFFEDLTASDLPEKIAFAFLDGDLYQSIKTSLKLVAPKMVSGGIIVVHDYNNPELPGSYKAVDEFVKQNSARLSGTISVRETLAILTF